MARNDSDSGYSQGPGLGTIVLVSIVTSIVVSVATVFVIERAMRAGRTETEAPHEEAAQGAIDVPSIAKMPPDGARELLQGRGLLMVIRGERPDPAVPAGWVVEQSPMPGSRVKKGAEIEAKVSSGPERVVVPAIVGKTLEEARAALEAAGLRVGPVADAEGGTPGAVTAATPAPGARVARDTEVMLSAVPAAPTEVDVPSLRRKSLAAARAELEALGLRLGSVREAYDDNLPARVVIRQSPAAGTKAAPGSAVDLVLNESD
ncbi:MAG: PASTA domain-containing protein [Actinobacteria bacterium]|nr:PASTA domain-containing protein [Actinomycetota bacterium]